MTKPTLDSGADTAPGADVTDGGSEQDTGTPGPERHSDRMAALRDADDATLEEMMANAPGMVPGDDEADDQEDDDAEGQGLPEDDEEHAEGEGAGHEDGDGGESDSDSGDDEGEQSDDDAGDEEGLSGDREEVALEDLEADGFAIVSLPARHEGDEDVRVPLDTEMLEELGFDAGEVVERFNQLRNGYARRQEAEAIVAEVEEDRRELDGIAAAIETDPAGFIMESVPADVRDRVAEDLLLSLDDDAYARIAEKVVKWARTPAQRKTAATEAENARLKAERDSAKASRTTAAVRAQVREIGKAIRSLVPEDMKERTSARFIKVAAGELQQYVKENKIDVLEPAKVPGILAELGVLEDFNLSSQGEGSSASNDSDDAPRRKPRKAAKKAASDSAGEKKKTKGVRERMRRRKRAASTPAGAGSAAASGFTKVPGETHEQRMERLSRHLGVKRRKK